MSLTWNRRQFIAGGAAVMGAGLLAGCSNGSDPNTLTIMGQTSEIVEDDVKEFESANPGVRLRIITPDPTALTAMFAAGNPPDIIRDLGVPNTPYLVARDLAENLDPYIANSSVLSKDKLAAANNVWRYDGTTQGQGPQYGLVKDYSQDTMLWLNTKIFADAGIDLPPEDASISLEEVLEMGTRLTQRNGAQYSVYGYHPAFGSTLTASFVDMATSAGGSIFNEDFSTVDFSSPEAIKVLEFYLKYTAAAVGATPRRPLPAGPGPTFNGDKLAILTYGYWFSGSIAGQDKMQDHVAFRPAATFGSVRTSPCTSGTGMWMAKRSKKKELAWKFIEHFFGGKPAERRAQSGWGLPGINSMVDMLPKEKPYQAQSLKVQEAELEHFSVLQFSPYIAMNALDAAISKELTQGLEAGSSAGQLADAINNAVNPLLQLGKELIS